MAIRFDLITEIDDTEFSRMFDDCVDALNGGSYPWEMTPVASGTNEEKKAYQKTCFQEFINADDGVVFVCSEDGYALTISAGNVVNETHFVGTMVLIGRNQAGSKSYMHAEEYHQAREEFWDEVNFVTWDFQTMGPGTAFFDHISNVYTETVTNNPAWIQNARSARLAEGDMTGELVATSVGVTVVPNANTEINQTQEIFENELGNSGLKMTAGVVFPVVTEGEFEDEEDEERLQWAAGTHPDQQQTEE